jgi:LysR family transcriptional regulator, benzoate and cis,cis-muconate-responsive activator of ben and cat genes
VGSTIYTSIPALLGQYRRLYPKVSLELQQLTVTRQTDLLLGGGIDVGIIRQAVSHPRLATHCIGREAFVAALPSDHRLAARPDVPLKLLEGEPMVAFSRLEAPAIYEQMRRMCDKAGFAPRIVQEAHPMSVVVGLVGAGAGVAIVPQSMESLAFQNVVYRPLRGTRELSEFFVAWRRGDDAATVENFLTVVRAQGVVRPA